VAAPIRISSGFGPLIEGSSIVLCNVPAEIFSNLDFYDYFSGTYYLMGAAASGGQSGDDDSGFIVCQTPYAWGNLWHLFLTARIYWPPPYTNPSISTLLANSPQATLLCSA
jgi:hypothetical protein